MMIIAFREIILNLNNCFGNFSTKVGQLKIANYKSVLYKTIKNVIEYSQASVNYNESHHLVVVLVNFMLKLIAIYKINVVNPTNDNDVLRIIGYILQPEL